MCQCDCFNFKVNKPHVTDNDLSQAERDKIAESLKDGFETGTTWPFNYRPGGPHVLRYRTSNNPEEDRRFRLLSYFDERKYQEWFRGFDLARELVASGAMRQWTYREWLLHVSPEKEEAA